MEWAYGITTVPERIGASLPRTLQSLAQAGFDRPRLFVDNCDDPKRYVERFGLEVTTHSPRIGAYGNWMLALGELYIRQPNAFRYAIFQDDCIASKGLRKYLESWYPIDLGYLNLYTFPCNQKLSDGKVGWYQSDQRGKGAVGLVFNRNAVLALITSKHALTKPQDPVKGTKSIDGGIVTSFVKAGGREWVHNPSLLQHTGNSSTLGNARHPLATSFRGESFDVSNL